MNELGNEPVLSVECGTCVAANTTACADCVVAHLLANDDGPIDYLTVEPVTVEQVAVAPPRSAAERELDRVVSLFAAAGLIDDPVEFVAADEFDEGRLSESVR